MATTVDESVQTATRYAWLNKAQAVQKGQVEFGMSTTRAVRRPLDLRRPVGRGLLEECLELALQAPSASNSSIPAPSSATGFCWSGQRTATG